MKTLLATVVVLFGLFFSSIALADCYSCASNPSPCSTCSAASNPGSDDCAVTNGCACSEPGCGKNPCLSKRRCCEVFGNVGALHEW